MDSLPKRAVTTYRDGGLSSLITSALREAYLGIYARLVAARGTYRLTLDDVSVTFSVPTPTMVRRNRSRFLSERDQLVDFVDELDASDTVYDVGANTGLYTLFAARKCRKGTVVAFEPYPPNLRILERDISRNKLVNVEVVDTALSNSTGTVQFTQPSEEDIGFGSSAITESDSGEAIEVPTTTGDALIEEGRIPAPNVVKIDVEGAEPLVIEGLSEALGDDQCRAVYCEVHLDGMPNRPSVEDFGSNLDDIRYQFEKLGFDIIGVTEHGQREVHLTARK